MDVNLLIYTIFNITTESIIFLLLASEFMASVKNSTARVKDQQILRVAMLLIIYITMVAIR